MVQSLIRSGPVLGLKASRVEIDGRPYGKVEGTAYVWKTVGNFGRRGGFQAINDYGFTASLEKRLSSENRDILCLRSHDPGRVLARTANDKLKVWEDDSGIHYEALFNLEDPESLGAFVLIEDGTLDASSMGYVPIESESVEMIDNSTEAVEAGKKDKRKVSMASEADLLEISIVAHGVYRGASALAAENELEGAGHESTGYVVIAQFTDDDVLIGQTVHRTYDYTVNMKVETEWEGEPYYSPLVRQRRETTSNSVEETTVEGDEGTSAEDDPEGVSESEGTPDEEQKNASENDLTWEQHFAELDEIGVAAFLGSG